MANVQKKYYVGKVIQSEEFQEKETNRDIELAKTFLTSMIPELGIYQ